MRSDRRGRTIDAHRSNVFPGEVRIVEEPMLQILKKNERRIVSCVAQRLEEITALVGGNESIGLPVKDQKRRAAGTHVVNRIGKLYEPRSIAEGRADEP